MKYLLLTFDIEEFDELRIQGIKSSLKERCEVSEKGLENVLDLLRKYNVKATFFTTYVFAMKAEKSIKRLLKEGHELGLHAYEHSDNYTIMDQDVAFKKLSKAKKELEKKFKTKIVGFRGPQMKRPSYETLKKLGIRYDSSLHPTWMPGHYNNFFDTRQVHEINDVVEIPLSVAPVFRFSLAWLFFRIFPLSYSKTITNLNFINTDFVNLYFHPWEFEDIKKYEKLSWIMKKNSGRKTLDKLEKYILWCKKKNVRAITMKEYVNGRS